MRNNTNRLYPKIFYIQKSLLQMRTNKPNQKNQALQNKPSKHSHRTMQTTKGAKEMKLTTMTVRTMKTIQTGDTTTSIHKRTNATYPHQHKIIKQLEQDGIITTILKGRIRIITLTKKGILIQQTIKKLTEAMK